MEEEEKKQKFCSPRMTGSKKTVSKNRTIQEDTVKMTLSLKTLLHVRQSSSKGIVDQLHFCKFDHLTCDNISNWQLDLGHTCINAA